MTHCASLAAAAVKHLHAATALTNEVISMVWPMQAVADVSACCPNAAAIARCGVQGLQWYGKPSWPCKAFQDTNLRLQYLCSGWAKQVAANCTEALASGESLKCQLSAEICGQPAQLLTPAFTPRLPFFMQA